MMGKSPIVYSLADVIVTITNDTLGSLTLTNSDASSNGAVANISMGAGSQFDSVGYTYDTNMFEKTSYADGGVVFTHNKAIDGTFTFSLGQTSPHNKDLMQYIQQARTNPAEAASTIQIKDSTGNVNVIGYNCFPQKMPDNTLGSSYGNRSYTFLSERIDEHPYSGIQI